MLAASITIWTINNNNMIKILLYPKGSFSKSLAEEIANELEFETEIADNLNVEVIETLLITIVGAISSKSIEILIDRIFKKSQEKSKITINIQNNFYRLPEDKVKLIEEIKKDE